MKDLLEYVFYKNDSNEGLQAQTKPLIEKFWEIAGVVFPVVLGVVALLIIIKLILLGMKLAQSGDDPEERSRIIKGMIWWGVGLLISIAAITSTAVIGQLFTPSK